MKMFLAMTALLATGAAIAQQPAPTPVAPPAPMHDKVTSRAEAVAKVREHFGRLDSNRDGALTTEEAMQGRARFAERHKRGEGGAPHAMMHGRSQRDPNAAFDRLDSNKDGAISRDEFAKGREERIERRMVIRDELKDGARDGKDVQKRAWRMHRMGGMGRMGGGHMLVMADTDKDGRITLAEAEAQTLRHFDEMDSNRDGQLTREERRAGRRMIIERAAEEKKSGS